MSDKEPRKLYVYQPEPAAETFKFAIGGPWFDPIRRARFASRDDAQAAMAEIERLRAVVDAAQTLHYETHAIAGEGGLNWRARMQEACSRYHEAAEAYEATEAVGGT